MNLQEHIKDHVCGICNSTKISVAPDIGFDMYTAESGEYIEEHQHLDFCYNCKATRLHTTYSDELKDVYYDLMKELSGEEQNIPDKKKENFSFDEWQPYDVSRNYINMILKNYMVV